MEKKKKKYAVVFVHGLAKKPEPKELERIWRWGLERDDPQPDTFAPPNPGINLDTEGAPALFTYWADVFYGEDYETDNKAMFERNAESAVVSETLESFESTESVTVESSTELAGKTQPPDPASVSAREKQFLGAFQLKLEAAQAASEARLPKRKARPGKRTVAATAPGQLEIASFLPDFMKEAIIKKAAMEAYYYLFNKEYVRPDGAKYMVRDELRKRMMNDLVDAAGQAEKVVLVTHSMGTIIGYDVLRNVAGCPQVDTFITLGSPLGVTEVQDELRAEGKGKVDYPLKAGRWINIYDPLDPICGADPRFANDYEPVEGKSVVDVEEGNWGNWRHTITHYFAGSLFRKHLAESIGRLWP
ncbi:hypothetical protein FN976_26960 [Caenimonas sedimenti]|uniref:Alpha/beta hydrolase n=1 Tax=Caenimonas sedimenti TaxID=2596921 RepID=A0A562ZEP8_9BURK|nr:hypothetical protein [Caenimonas sedimenti]TWO66021.1 hypothetical protein FN976_26960 [Caenimonas sedimenti]